MTKVEKAYIEGFNTALDRVKEYACNYQDNIADIDIIVVLDIVDELRDIVNGTTDYSDDFN